MPGVGQLGSAELKGASQQSCSANPLDADQHLGSQIDRNSCRGGNLIKCRWGGAQKFARVGDCISHRYAKDDGAQAHAVVEVGVPADGLFGELLPTDKNVVGRLAFQDEFQPALEVREAAESDRWAIARGLYEEAIGLARETDQGMPLAAALAFTAALFHVLNHSLFKSLLFFGAEGFRNQPFWDFRMTLGPLGLSGQTLIIFGVSMALIVWLWLYFGRSLRGKALRATAVNRTGARLMGISTHASGQLTLLLAAFIGALSGLLIGPTTTVFYDSGFLIGLKGFVAAVIAGLSSYPGALLGALFVGVVESFGSFWASAFKEVIVFTLVLPILLVRSLRSGHSDEDH